MKILLLEPFYSGSHAAWADELKTHSSHDITLMTLPGRHWKWRMHGGAVSLAEQFLESNTMPELILASDMLDLNLFLSLTRNKTRHIPTAIYFHENQLTYPWSPTDQDVKLQRDNHYSFINYSSALAADQLFFNSSYHLNSFIDALKPFLSAFPDHQNLTGIARIKAKSKVLHLGLDLQKLDEYKLEKQNEVPLILWNHRWEYDKNPEDFFQVLIDLDEKGISFQLAVLGESYENAPKIFQEVKEKLKDKIVAFGFCESFEIYAHWLWKANIIPITSYQDFFGGSVVQAMYCNVFPLLPKRLAYPEHLPPSVYDTYFYEDQQELSISLEQAILNFKNLPSPRDEVKKYDWKNCIEAYDAILSFSL